MLRFAKRATANYYDCDAADRLKISAAMRYMQQTSSEHLESLGMSPVKLYREGMVFLLSKTCLKIHRMPWTAEEIKIATAATETRGARFVREFVVEALDGERLISAFTLWLLTDIEAHKILRPSKFPYPLPFETSMLDEVIGDVKLSKPDSDQTIMKELYVNYSHIDTNSHVNNSIYADFVCDALPYDKLVENGLDMLAISFLNEAKPGHKIEMTIDTQNEKEYYMMGKHRTGVCFEAVAKLK